MIQQSQHYHFDSPAAAAAAADDDDDDDGDCDGACVDDVYSRPDRPRCVPKIDLSWTTDDDHAHATRHRTTHTIDHVRHESNHCAHHVTQDGGPAEVVVKRGRHRRQRHVRYKTKLNAHATCITRPTYTLPLTPQTPRRQTVRRLDIPEKENGATKQEVEINRTGIVLNGEHACDSTNRHDDVISARDVTVNTGIMQHDINITSPVRTKAADDVEICHSGSNNVHNDSVSPPSLMSIQRPSAAVEIVRHDGGDAVCVERESSPSLAERLLCVFDCCHCCRLSLTMYH